MPCVYLLDQKSGSGYASLLITIPTPPICPLLLIDTSAEVPARAIVLKPLEARPLVSLTFDSCCHRVTGQQGRHMVIMSLSFRGLIFSTPKSSRKYDSLVKMDGLLINTKVAFLLGRRCNVLHAPVHWIKSVIYSTG